MNLMQCDIHSHSTFHIMEQFQIRPKIIYHVGGSHGLEFDIYQRYGARTRWFECNPFIFGHLKERIRNSSDVAHMLCLWSQDNLEKEFYFYRNQQDGAASLFQPDRFYEYVDDCKLTGEKITVKTITLDTFVKDLGLEEETKNVDFLNLDIQGAELEFLKGSSILLEGNLKWIYCETSSFAVYKDAPLESEITEYLQNYGFNRIGYRKDWGSETEHHGDSIYYR